MKQRITLTYPACLPWLAAASLALASVTASASQAPDLDGDGVPNIVDPDIDGDGIPNALDDNIDGGIARSGPYAGQYIGDHVNNDNPAEKDMDADGQSDDSLGETDIDGDGKPDDSALENDIDGDRRPDDFPSETDIDGDGRLDDSLTEDDIDGDSLDDDDLMEYDIDGDGLDDSSDDDIDGDNRGNSGDLDDDTDGDGVTNDLDDDSDGDGLSNREDDDDDNDGSTDEDDSDHHDESDEAEIQVILDLTASAPAGSRCRVKVQRMATGKIELTVKGDGFPAGTYDVLVDGSNIGPLVMTGSSSPEGEVEFETNANDEDEINLTIDPIGLPIGIVRAGVTYFTGTVPTPPAPNSGGGGETGGGDTNPDLTTLTPAPSLPGEASATLQLQFGVFGLNEAEVQVEGVAAGNYSFLVGSILRGTIEVTTAGNANHGELRFAAIADEPDELPLDFAIPGEAIEITKDGITTFSGTVHSGE